MPRVVLILASGERREPGETVRQVLLGLRSETVRKVVEDTLREDLGVVAVEVRGEYRELRQWRGTPG